MTQRVLVGVSGGVDSAVTLLSLLDEGYSPVPVYLKMKEGLDEADARRLDRLEEVTGLPVLRLDCRDRFCRCIIDPFVQALKAGFTPNPCVWCNQQVKMKLLFDEADRQGCELVSTGHYAQVLPGPTGKPALAKAASSKDQSYMLYRIEPSWIPRLHFRLGKSEKAGVRTYAQSKLGREYGGGDSQDICFLNGRDLDEYIDTHLTCHPGPMVTCDGVVLGRHRGLAHYTLGQRKGLGLNKGPWFVVEKRAERNELVLDHSRKQVRTVVLTGSRLLLPLPERCTVRTRYRGGERICRPVQDGDRLVLQFDQPVEAVAPGQSGVLYQEQFVVGGGFIAAED